MQESVRIALDAMGGDNAPGEIVKGAVYAVKEKDNIHVILVGREEAIRSELSKYSYPEERVEIVISSEVITTEEAPVMAIRKKKDSSIVVGQGLVRKGEADAFVSAGSTGAILVGGQLVVGRLRGVERSPLATLIPTEKGVALLVDSGANVDARSSHLVQFARMGSIYMEHIIGIKQPRVAIVNVGVEEEKGNALVKETYPLLKACGDIHFTGSIEAREIPHGGADVIVAEGFTGNVILKLYEGTASALMSQVKKGLMSSFRSKLGALLIKPALKKTLKSFDATEYGGAPMLGLKGLVVKTHGNASAKEVKNTLFQCLTFKEQRIGDRMKELFSDENNQKG